MLGVHFFNAARAGRRVYLCVTHELLDDLGKASSANARDFVEAVKRGPDGMRFSNVCQAAASLSGSASSSTIPPFLGYLCFFVLAAGLEGDFALHAYYPRLRTLLGEHPYAGTYPFFERTTNLWEELEQWSCVTCAGEIGMFMPRWYVKWKHVGLPMGQSLLSEDEIRALPEVFARSGLDPSAPPSAGDLQRVLSRFGSSFRPRTMKLLRNIDADEETARDALIDVVAAELAEWDGCGTVGPDGSETLNGVMRVCCDLDSTAGTAVLYYRCKLPLQLPDDGLDLAAPGQHGETVQCDEEGIGLGWSTPLVTSAGRRLESDAFDLAVGTTLTDEARDISVRLPARNVRVLGSGISLGLPGYVEIGRLCTGSPFLVLARLEEALQIAQWGRSSCPGWKEPATRGVPVGWRLFYGESATTDQPIRRSFPILSLPRQVRVRFVGGIRVDRSERYFAFAPPRISVEAPTDTVVYCDDVELVAQVDGMFNLPVPKPTRAGSTRMQIQVLHEDGIEKRSLILDEAPATWTAIEPQQWVGAEGSPEVDPSAAAASGAIVRFSKAEAFSFVGAIPVLSWAPVRYLGAAPGQISNWPEEDLPPWQPVWVVQARRKGFVQFCGTDVEKSAPCPMPSGDKKRVREWKEVVWHRRKHLTAPENARLRRLWEEYQDLARKL